jgi:hypothetical protein
MALVTDFLDLLSTTWSKYSVYTNSYSGNYGPTLKHAKKTPAQAKAAEKLKQGSLQEDKAPEVYSLADVAAHDRPGDCWIIVKEKVTHAHSHLPTFSKKKFPSLSFLSAEHFLHGRCMM